jgi:hypothetical protein
MVENEYAETVNQYYDGNLGPMINNDKKTTFEVDFSGDELEKIAQVCKRKNITLSEFIDNAIRNYVYGDNE